MSDALEETEAAHNSAQRFLENVIRTPGLNGELRLEWRQGDWNIEIEFNAEGRIVAAFIGRNEPE